MLTVLTGRVRRGPACQAVRHQGRAGRGDGVAAAIAAGPNDDADATVAEAGSASGREAGFPAVGAAVSA